MRKYLILLLGFILTMPIINSCKKGADDPFISLRSREGRLKGEWNLTSGTANIVDGTSTTIKTFDGSLVTITTDGQSATYTHTEKLEFLKDNVYKSTKLNDNNTEIVDGYWAFMDSYGDMSDNQCVVIKASSVFSGGSYHSYTGDEMPMSIINLKKLSNSELITEISGTAFESSTSTSTIIKTYEKK